MKKNHSIIAHAIHSRLQLIRNKIQITPQMSPSEIVAFNQKYFDMVGVSVERYHNHTCNKLNYYEAAELFQSAFLSDDRTIEKQPIWTAHKNDFYVVEVRGAGKDEWNPMTEEMLEIGKRPEIKKMSHTEAMELHRQLSKRGSSANFRVSGYKPQV